MSETRQLYNLLSDQNIQPIAVHDTATESYVVSPMILVNGIQGFPILRVSSPTATHTYMDNGFLLESVRAVGANGSAADVDIKADATNSLLILASLIYG